MRQAERGDDSSTTEGPGRQYSHDHLLATQKRVADELASSQGNGAVVVGHGCRWSLQENWLRRDFLVVVVDCCRSMKWEGLRKFRPGR
jgi:hypothetical protein